MEYDSGVVSEAGYPCEAVVQNHISMGVVWHCCLNNSFQCLNNNNIYDM